MIDFNGHMSCRIPGTGHVLINSGKSVRSALTAEDVIAIDMDGKPVEGDVVPPMEFHIHTEIYRQRPDVNAVAHTHPMWSTLFSMTGVPVEPVIMQAAVLGPIRVFPKTASINQKAVGRGGRGALGADRLMMLKSHGAVVVGADIVEAFVLAIYLEETAQRQYLARALGTPQRVERGPGGDDRRQPAQAPPFPQGLGLSPRQAEVRSVYFYADRRST